MTIGESHLSIFSPGFIAHVNEFHEQEFQCLDGSVPKFLGGGFDKVVAVLAAQSSSVTLQASTTGETLESISEPRANN